MVEANFYTIDLTIFDTGDKFPYSKIIGIVLNCQMKNELFHWILSKTDKIICADGGANVLYDSTKGKHIPEWIVGDFDSIRKDVKDFYVSKGVKIVHRSNLDTTDIEKSIYVALEKLSDTDQFKQKSAIFVIGSGGRVDHTYSTFSSVYKYQKDYKELNIDVFMISLSSISFFLRPGMNRIITSKKLELRNEGYSFVCFGQSGKIELKEIPEEGHEKSAMQTEKEIKLGDSVIFRKKHHAKEIHAQIDDKDPDGQIPFLYSFTTIHHIHN